MRVRLSVLIFPVACIVAFVAFRAVPAVAQSQYRNLDAGRPIRIEDAEAPARYSLDIDLAPFQIERLTGGMTRYRAEPRLGYGILPFTELELRAPLVQVNPPSGTNTRSAAGFAGLSVGVLRALNLETTYVPALALSAETSLPVGTLAATQVSYLVKGLVTKTTALGRVHLNAGIGRYAVRPAAVSSSDDCGAFRLRLAGDSTCSGGPPIIIDVPCASLPQTSEHLTSSRMCMPMSPESTTVASPTSGRRWFAGAAFDRSFPLRSLAIMGDVFAERFEGLYPTVDWTGEVGLRYQLTPVMVVDAGVGRHFAGLIHSTSFTIGATYELATPPLFGR